MTELVAPQRLRHMAHSQFAEAYSCDRFTATVISNRLRYAVEHMSAGLLRQAFSPIIRDWYDFACTITGPALHDFSMPVVSNSLMVFLGTMADAVRNAVIEFGPENLSPGDVLITNDPFRVGNHVNDICFIHPVFVNGELVSYVNLRAHQIDVGGLVAAGFSATKKNIYEEGISIPPLLLFQGGKPVRSAFSLIFDNSRMGELLLPDIMTIHQQLKLGEQLILSNIERYGLDAYLGTLRYACDSSAELMRDAIARIPDGDYFGEELIDADGMDDTEEYWIRVTLRKRGHNVEADLSGTSRQARTCINAGVLEAKTAVGVALTALLDPHIPFTSGSWRNIDIAVPAGTILSSRPPEGGTMMYWEAEGALVSAVCRALDSVLGPDSWGGDYGSPSVHNGHGVLADGTPWANVTLCGGEHGPWGATKDADGDSYTVIITLNNLDPATEAIEHDSPVVILRKEVVQDSGGPGANRGGAGIMKDSMWMVDANHFSSPFRTKNPTASANGGKSGATGGVWMFPAEVAKIRERQAPIGTTVEAYRDSTPVAGVLDVESKAVDPSGQYFYFASEPLWKTQEGGMFRYVTNGAGGWGDPFTRDPERVRNDVRDGYVSIDGARRDYGVVITGDPENDPEALTIDEQGTNQLRAAAGAPARS